MFLPRQVARTVRRHDLFGHADRVLIALSGGADSVALSWVLWKLQARSAWQVAGCVHVNHGLRGVASDEDEGFCRQLVARLGWPLEVVRVDLSTRPQGRSPEAAARAARYEAFAQAAAALGATVIATAHTMDDQAETVLLRLLRGAGSRGLSGIRMRRGVIRRPLLECTRADVGAYLERLGETFREDASNRDESIPRNRVRRRVLPVLSEFSPGAVRALARCAALAADDEAYLSRVAGEALAAVSRPATGEVMYLDAARLSALPPALSRRVIRDALTHAVPSIALTGRHLEAVGRLAASPRPTGRLDLPGLVVHRRGGLLDVSPAGSLGAENAPVGFDYALSVPGAVDVTEAGARISATSASGVDAPRTGSADAVSVQVGSFVPPLRVRSRQPGDRLRPLGAPGHRKLQDVFVDRKIPRDRRDAIPVVVDAEGRIIWVVGVAVAHECRVTKPEGGMVILEVRVS